MIDDVSTDINDFLDVPSDLTTSASNTQDSKTGVRVANVLLEAKLQWLENLDKTPLSERIDTPEPDIMDIAYADMREKLSNLRRREKPKVMNFNMETGRIRR